MSRTAKQVLLLVKWNRKSELCCKLLPGVLSIAIVSCTHDYFRHLFYLGVLLASEPLSGASQCCDWFLRVICSRAVGKPSPGPGASARLMQDDNCPKAQSPAHVQDCNDGQTAQATPEASFKPNDCDQSTEIQPQVKQRIAQTSRGTTQQAGRDNSSKYSQPVCRSSQPSAVGDLLTRTDWKAIRARSALLDIPSAELLKSLLDYADVVCEGSQEVRYLENAMQLNSP